MSTRDVDSARQDRIDAVLGSRSDPTVATLAALQTDPLDTHAQRLLPKLLDGVATSTPDGAARLARLRAWDFVAVPPIASGGSDNRVDAAGLMPLTPVRTALPAVPRPPR